MRLKIFKGVVKQSFSDSVLPEPMPQATSRGAVQLWALSAVEANRRDRVIAHVLGNRVEEIESLLEAADAKHLLQIARRSATAGDQMNWCDECALFCPRNAAVHAGE